jgi:exodeoxyribonuclease VII large subunit
VTARRRGVAADPAGDDLDLFPSAVYRAPAAPPPPRREPAIPGTRPDCAVSVGILTRTTKDVLEGAFVPLWVRGEVSDFKSHRNGHWYFTLRDAEAQLRCVMWARDRRRGIPAPPDDGMMIAALGQLTVYPARGDLRFTVTAMEAEGGGLWRKAMEQTRARLEAEGLLHPTRKRPIPRYPRRIVIITSQDGAALHDIVSVARRRNPGVEIVLVPAVVQGEAAPASLCAALAKVARWCDADTLIIGRGGGSREDLWAFNDEQVARAVATCPIPTISAVGHEVDITICDLVADLRAATPSAAAEAAVPIKLEIAAKLESIAAALPRLAAERLAAARDRATETARALRVGAARTVDRRRLMLGAVGGRLDALSPLSTMRRGYTVTRDLQGRTIRGAGALARNDTFDVLFHDGTVRAKVQASAPGTPAGSPPARADDEPS